jgi:hypothetical protein
MRIALASVVCPVAAFLCVGCTLEYRRPIVSVDTPPPVVVEETPVGELVTVEPAPVERQYVYLVGYPPGCYLSNNYYWYGGRRYERDVFINRVVNVNIRERRYVNVTENRRVSQQIETTRRTTNENNAGAKKPTADGRKDDGVKSEPKPPVVRPPAKPTVPVAPKPAPKVPDKTKDKKQV